MEASTITDHISRRFNKDLEDLRNSVLTMGGLVEAQLSRAIVAIVSGDSELGIKVANDDYKVNSLEVSIDEECSRIIATRAPAASDLSCHPVGEVGIVDRLIAVRTAVLNPITLGTKVLDKHVLERRASVIGAAGVEKILTFELTDSERAELEKSAASVSKTVAETKL